MSHPHPGGREHKAFHIGRVGTKLLSRRSLRCPVWVLSWHCWWRRFGLPAGPSESSRRTPAVGGAQNGMPSRSPPRPSYPCVLPGNISISESPCFRLLAANQDRQAFANDRPPELPLLRGTERNRNRNCRARGPTQRTLHPVNFSTSTLPYLPIWQRIASFHPEIQVPQTVRPANAASQSIRRR